MQTGKFCSATVGKLEQYCKMQYRRSSYDIRIDEGYIDIFSSALNSDWHLKMS